MLPEGSAFELGGQTQTQKRRRVPKEEKDRALTVQLQGAAAPNQPRGLGRMTSVVIESRDRQLEPV
jgi:hypothetical protein